MTTAADIDLLIANLADDGFTVDALITRYRGQFPDRPAAVVDGHRVSLNARRPITEQAEALRMARALGPTEGPVAITPGE
ncbi:hypothetical protein [Xylanimonas ulmi]|uniref:Uncharacterized protein n=1 Tax=Xylanimonas ulmi TaxID=228973 RepID=A0A4Q7M0P8_9MICO|nr:hypothetical protein [Xylanibacterium ulmi]RZS60463.1 hypothetical protein EV386_0721 [Xylanibacterium ulmi]